MNRINLFYTLIASTLLLTNCKKNEVNQDKLLNNNTEKQADGGDGKWDVLGYGYKASQDMLSIDSRSDASILDMLRFEKDFLDENDSKHEKVRGIDVNRTTETDKDIIIGSSAYTYLHNVSNKKSLNANGSYTIPYSEDPDPLDPQKKQLLNFTASFKKNKEDYNNSTVSSRFSYGTFELWHRVKRIRFTEDVSMQTLVQYLTPEFKNFIAANTADEIVRRYGTHILMDISLGSRIRLEFSGVLQTDYSESKKVSDTNIGLGVSVANVFGINLNGNKTKEEITQITNDISRMEYKGKQYGGANSGQTISFDSKGNATNFTFSEGSWQQSVTDRNAALINIGKAVFIYDFITDATKKAQVKAAVERYMKSQQISEIDDKRVPVYSYVKNGGGIHLLSLSSSEGSYWKLEKTGFYALPTQTAYNLPVRWYTTSPTMRDNLYTLGFGDNYWNNLKGFAFFAFRNQESGTVPVYEYTNKDGKDHYYSTEIEGDPYWKNRGIAFYAYPTR